MLASHTKLEKICAKNPTSILFARLADTFLARGDVKRALEICRRGLRYRPSYATGHVVMGRCHLAAGRLEEARQEFQKALQLDADNLAAFWRLGQIDLQMGWEDLALQNFKKASALDPFSRELTEQISALQGLHAKETPAPPGRQASNGQERTRAPQTPPAEEWDGSDSPSAVSAPARTPPSSGPETARGVQRGAGASDGGREAGEDLASLVREIGRNNAGNGAVESDASCKSGQKRAEPIITFTLAELYAAQGLVQQAIRVLERVSERDPDNDRVMARLEELRESAGAPGQNAR